MRAGAGRDTLQGMLAWAIGVPDPHDNAPSQSTSAIMQDSSGILDHLTCVGNAGTSTRSSMRGTLVTRVNSWFGNDCGKAWRAH